jgi:hypothetical protein
VGKDGGYLGFFGRDLFAAHHGDSSGSSPADYSFGTWASFRRWPAFVLLTWLRLGRCVHLISPGGLWPRIDMREVHMVFPFPTFPSLSVSLYLIWVSPPGWASSRDVIENLVPLSVREEVEMAHWLVYRAQRG